MMQSVADHSVDVDTSPVDAFGAADRVQGAQGTANKKVMRQQSRPDVGVAAHPTAGNAAFEQHGSGSDHRQLWMPSTWSGQQPPVQSAWPSQQSLMQNTGLAQQSLLQSARPALRPLAQHTRPGQQPLMLNIWLGEQPLILNIWPGQQPFWPPSDSSGVDGGLDAGLAPVQPLDFSSSTLSSGQGAHALAGGLTSSKPVTENQDEPWYETQPASPSPPSVHSLTIQTRANARDNHNLQEQIVFKAGDSLLTKFQRIVKGVEPAAQFKELHSWASNYINVSRDQGLCFTFPGHPDETTRELVMDTSAMRTALRWCSKAGATTVHVTAAVARRSNKRQRSPTPPCQEGRKRLRTMGSRRPDRAVSDIPTDDQLGDNRREGEAASQGRKGEDGTTEGDSSDSESDSKQDTGDEPEEGGRVTDDDESESGSDTDDDESESDEDTGKEAGEGRQDTGDEASEDE